MTSDTKWHAFDADGGRVGRFGTRQAAMNWLERCRYQGGVSVQHISTGERWERHRGSWFKTEPGQRQQKGRAA